MLDLLLFYALFFGIAMVLPSIRVWRSTGVNPLVLPSNDSVEGFVGRMLKLLVAGLGIYLVLGSVGLISAIAGRFSGLETGFIHRLGWALMGISLVWVVIAQFQMGRSWRVGIDAAVRTDLVRRGLFRRSRNPIFLGMLVQLVGLFLVLPNGMTLAVLLGAYILISTQIRLEEVHLAKLHGDDYAAFCATVRRWL